MAEGDPDSSDAIPQTALVRWPQTFTGPTPHTIAYRDPQIDHRGTMKVRGIDGWPVPAGRILPVKSEYVRDAAVTAAIFGFFAMAWFGWAQDAPPRRWRPYLAVGSVLAALTAVGGGVLTWRHWSDGTALGPDSGPTFGIIVGIEVVTAGLGAAVLSWRRRPELMPVWIAFVVGVHFFPLAPLFHYGLLYMTAAVVTAVAVLAVPTARRRSLAPSAVTGLGTGVALLVSAVVSLVAAATG
jgi:hypothetical protein